jgi:thiamine-monophosphate kinase
MGGDPIAAFLSLAAPRHLPQVWINRFLDGLLALARKFGVTLAGGDIAESPAGVLADIVVLGSTPRGRAILRSGARPGDGIYVSGNLGRSAAALERLLSGGKASITLEDYARHLYPTPRITLARYLREHRLARAMIDLSDGLSTDLAHICEESHVGAEIDAAQIPLAQIGKARSAVELKFALHGGEDYELLFTASRRRQVPAKILGVPVTRVGEIFRGRGMRLRFADGRKQPLPARGWQHFRP